MCPPHGWWHRGFCLGTGTYLRGTITNGKRNRAAQHSRSSAHDAEEAASSIEAQEQYCSQYAADAGFEVDAERAYRELGSGSGPDRPNLQRLLHAAEDGQIDAVIVTVHV